MAKYKFLLILNIFLFSLIGFSIAENQLYIFAFLPTNGNYISEINLTSPSYIKEISRHWTVPTGFGGNPSRTAIDSHGNVWVGNRATNTLVKVGNLGLGTCVDKNGNGQIDTTRDTNNNGVIEDSEIVSFENDECILKEVVFPLVYAGNWWPAGYIDHCYPGWIGWCHCPSDIVIRESIDLTPFITETGSYKFLIWDTTYWVGWLNFRLVINMTNGSVRYIENDGDYGDIVVKAYHSSIPYYDCNNIPYFIDQRADTEFNGQDWFTTYWWPSCNYCDYYGKIEMIVRNIDWSSIKLEFYAYTFVFVWTNSSNYPKSRQQMNDGAGVTAVCVDRNDNVYAGMHDYQVLYYLSSDGQILKTIDLSKTGGCSPTGCLVDKDGNVWVACDEQRFAKYYPSTDNFIVYPQGIPISAMSLTATGDGIVFTGGSSGKIRKIMLNGSEAWTVGDVWFGSGIVVDSDDYIYVIGSEYDQISKLNSSGSFIKNLYGICANPPYQPSGIGIDYYENIWLVCGDGRILMLNKELNTLNSFKIANSSHVYSNWISYSIPTTTTTIPFNITVTGPLVLIPLLLGNPLFFVIVFGLALATAIESKIKSGGWAFLLTFIGVLIMFAIFSGTIPLWFVLVLIALVIGGIVFLKR
jgi:hypothetical protein